MKIWHWLLLILAAVGAVYIWHNYRSHGGVSGVKQGLGFGGSA